MNTDFLKGKKLLIAEDDFVNQKLITHSLQPTGAHFDIAGNGQEAVDMLRQGQYDLVLMDINMPEMDGFEATQIIRKEINATIPIIAMTGWSSRTEGDKFTQVGMNGCLAKPFGLDALFKTLDQIFQHNPVVPTVSSDNTVLGVPEVELPKIDLVMLNELADGDTDYKTTIVNMFLESMPESIQKMEDFLAEKNWDGLYKAAHYAKSSLSVVKAPDMHALAGAIESHAKKGEDLDNLAPALAIFKRYFTQVQEQLKAELATWKP